MTVPYHIQGESGCEKIITDTFFEIDQTFNIWNKNSELSRFNAGETPLSPTLKEVLFYARDQTDEYFDPTIGKAIAAWKSAMPFGKQPEGRFASGWKHIDIESGTKSADVAIDLDGLIKGYAIDLLLCRLPGKKVCVEWGGDIRVRGTWNILVGDEVLKVCDEAIATSGPTHQQFVVDGKTYTHIFNTDGKPLLASKVQEVSVRAPTCLEADILATKYSVSGIRR